MVNTELPVLRRVQSSSSMSLLAGTTHRYVRAKPLASCMIYRRGIAEFEILPMDAFNRHIPPPLFKSCKRKKAFVATCNLVIASKRVVKI